ncbi:MAG: S41 family peptidase [Lachnospiraceae bacterium]|nr:S41 family peptidase [Lachnospiraceae bacterium]
MEKRDDWIEDPDGWLEKGRKGERDNRFLKGVLTGVLCSLLVAAAATWGIYFLLSARGLKEVGQTEDYEEVEEKLEMLKGMVDTTFLYEADEEAMKEGIYKGFIAGLGDPYTVYYTEEEYKDMMESSDGEYVGIGVQISQSESTNVITVIRVFRGSGAEEAGMQAGDMLYKVNGEDITGEDINNVVAKIRGNAGSTVHIEVYRDSVNDYVEMDVERRDVSMDTVEWKMLENGMGYLQITEFDGVTYEQFVTALEDLKAQGMKGLLLDLRDNPGGRLDQVVEIADDFLTEGVIVSTKSKTGLGSTYEADEEIRFDGPMVVLTNGNSASASEVLAGALKDYEKAVLVGTTTFGKGIVQSIYPFDDGTAIKITISDYYTPNGANIHGTGIEPDVMVEKEKGKEEDQDHQLEKAKEVLTGKMK